MIERTDNYWAKRAAEQLAFVEGNSIPYLKRIDRIYRTARKNNVDAVRKLYENHYRNEGFDLEALKQLAPKTDIRRFKEAVERAGFSSRLPDRYAYRLSRLELIEAQMWLEVREAAKQHAELMGYSVKDTIDTAYDYAGYNLAKGTNVPPAFTQLNTKAINRIAKTKFKGVNYSNRVWNNSTKLARKIQHELAASIASGESSSKLVKRIKDAHDVTRYEASRLIRTETNYFNTLATSERYEDIGIEQFVFVGTLDGRTSEICQHLDGKRFPMTDEENKPPQHPNCRSCIRAWLGDEYEPDTRIARDEEGKNYYIPNMSYEQWQKTKFSTSVRKS